MTDATVVESTMVRRVADHLRRHGTDPHAVLQAAGVDAVLADPNVQPRLIPFAEAMRVYAEAAKALHDPALSLSIALEAAPRDYGLTGLLWEHQPKLGDALDALAMFYNRFFPNSELVVTKTHTTVTVLHRFFVDVPGLDIFRIELLASLYRHSLRVSPEPWVPLSLSFAREPHDLDRFREVFGIEPTFEPQGSADVMVIPRAPMERANPGANPALLSELLRAAETHADRRKQQGAALSGHLQLVGCTVDLSAGVVRRGEEEVPLTTKERALLEYLAQRRNETVTHGDIETDVWGMSRSVISHAPAVAIRRLRQKIEPAGRKPVNLQTVFGEGWRLVIAPQ